MTGSAPNNWLLISFDQWRGDWLHQPWLRVPHLRQLASSGWDVRRCYTASPQCVPARVSWLTGQRPATMGLTANTSHAVPADAPSFVRQLKQRGGHRTVLVGKTHWTPHAPGVDLRDNGPLLQALGFDRAIEIAGPRALAHVACDLSDRWRDAGVLQAYREDLEERYSGGCTHRVRPTPLPDHLYPDLWLTGVALEELERLPQDQPWLLWVSFVGPHEPFDVPRSWRGRGTTGPVPPPLPRPTSIPAGAVLARKLARWPDGLPADAVTALRADYADHCHLLDEQLGRLLQALRGRRDAGRTAVTICSDHGELLGDWGLLLKSCFLEGAIRSLFLHRPPGGRHGLRRLWRADRRPYGLTECLWAAADAVGAPEAGSFGARLRTMPPEVTVDYAEEAITLS